MPENTRTPPRVPKHIIEFNRQKDYDSILDWLRWAKDNVWQTMMAEQKLRAEHQTFLLYGFLAETGLTPSKCMLVEERTSKGELLWGYVKKDPEKVYANSQDDAKDQEIARLNGLVKYFQALIAELKDELTHVKGKR